MKRALFLFLLSFLLTASLSNAAGRHKGGYFNDHRLMVCNIQEVMDVMVFENPVMVVIYDCEDDESNINRFITVDKTFNISHVNGAMAEHASLTVDSEAEYFATIGRLHFFKASGNFKLL